MNPPSAVASLERTVAKPPEPFEMAAAAGLRSVRLVAWRDLDDPEAGGSELHADRLAAQWAAGGLDVTVRTSAVPGGPAVLRRDGYRVVRRSGRYRVFPSVALEGWGRPARPGEGLVEVWNGMPFWSPLWFRGPRVVLLHHVHAEMWRMVLPEWMARLGWATEHRLAPSLYRSARVVTLSESSRSDIVDTLGLAQDRVSVAPPGVDPMFTPGPGRTLRPLVVAVGRLVPVKRFELLIEALVVARRQVPELRAEIVGEGYARPELERLRRQLGATEWLELPGALSREQLVTRYRRAWVVASSSLREGWGMTLTEAAACGTPSVATDIVGHRDAVVDGVTGRLATGADGLGAAMVELLRDDGARWRMGAAARERAGDMSWEVCAGLTLAALAQETARRLG